MSITSIREVNDEFFYSFGKDSKNIEFIAEKIDKQCDAWAARAFEDRTETKIEPSGLEDWEKEQQKKYLEREKKENDYK